MGMYSLSSCPMVSFASRERVFIFVGSPIRDVRVLLVQVDSLVFLVRQGWYCYQSFQTLFY